MSDYSENMYDYGSEDCGAPSPFEISQGLITGCHTVLCNKKEGLSRCGGCKVVSYCNRDDQAADRGFHKTYCKSIKKAQALYEKEEAALRAHPGNWMMSANPFESCVGHFWGVTETRDYMRARYGVVDAIMKINTFAAVEAALNHILDMLRLSRGDNMGVRDIAPHLYLRLGRDQECYDFCKWWETVASKGDYSWDDDGPYLDLRGEDVFESVDAYTGKFPNISSVLAITLLKIRLLIGLQTLQRGKQEAGAHVPQEILDNILQHSVSGVLKDNRSILDRADHTPQIQELKKQVKQLFDCVRTANKYMWPAILKPGSNLRARPSYISRGTPREMQVKLQYCYNAWVETPGAIAVIEELSKQ
jgi:hypothetical protein